MKLNSALRSGLLFACIYQLFLCAIVVTFLFIRNPSFSLFQLQDRLGAWDGAHYIFLSQHGYVKTGDEANFIVFYPLYPLLIRANPLFVLSPYISAWSISIIGSIVGHTFFYAWADKKYGAKRARPILFLFCLSPISVYFTHVYTEGLYLAISAAMLYFLEEKKHLLSASLGMLSSATRLVGITSIIPYLWSFHTQLNDINLFTNHHLHLSKIKSILRPQTLFPILYSVLIPVGFLTFLGINIVVFGSPTHYQLILKNHWYKEVTNPVQTYINYARGFSLQDLFINDNDHFVTQSIDVFITLLVPFILIAYIAKERKKTEWGLVAWTLSQLYIVCAQSFWLSNTRYIALILPLYVFLERIFEKGKALYILLCILSLIVMIFCIDLFAQGAWVF
ncbi:hypothetical protein C5B42_05920 [Candidatus Cerribacteria bacterium 'Amazon FNV 2010 28 9']|uniref:Glycosyltransferase RgtA/B/C/D-like domain-containing protein n=1 Tax=Candidatus Cerribacteria bacterium 'Amazon FNV 2010 28 9' TaxID=2081795 RepID=A0A317JM53_9BACT|nr:MAG: hypothetical protein C5B42_05920 [Candidatus Cerribacteria bacterium 'Amazon FNV 2010 28 9']